MQMLGDIYHPFTNNRAKKQKCVWALRSGSLSVRSECSPNEKRELQRHINDCQIVIEREN